MLEKVELSEEETLKQLTEQFEDLCKAREEQEEKYEAVKNDCKAHLSKDNKELLHEASAREAMQSE